MATWLFLTLKNRLRKICAQSYRLDLVLTARMRFWPSFSTFHWSPAQSVSCGLVAFFFSSPCLFPFLLPSLSQDHCVARQMLNAVGLCICLQLWLQCKLTLTLAVPTTKNTCSLCVRNPQSSLV